MKTNKWLRITLTALLTLVVLGATAFAGYRLGISQNPQVIQQIMQWRALRYSRMVPFVPQAADGSQVSPQAQQGNAPQQNPNGWTYNPHAPGFNPRGGFDGGFSPRARFDRRDDFGRGGFFPFPNLLTLALLAALIWLGYKYAKNSGWKIVRETPQGAAPVAEEKQDAA